MKKTLLILALIATALGLGSQAKAQILYKVEKGDSKPSYILGTHHFAPLSAVDEIEELPGILTSIDKLYGEVDMELMTNPEALMSIQQKLLAPADSTLDKVFTPAQLDTIKTAWKNLTSVDLPLDMMKGFKPSIINVQLAALMTQKVLPQLNPLEGIDNTMQTRAKSLGKPVAGLETVDFQIDMLYNKPIAKQAEELMSTIKDIDKEEQKVVELSQAYMAHDINKIYEVMTTAANENEDEFETLLFSRNDNWVKILSEEMPGASLMVVVGAGHLPGERGVLEGLKKAGFTITPVK